MNKLLAISGILLVAGSVGLGVVISILYDNAQAEHACQALKFILGARLSNHQFAAAIRYWYDSDHCG